MTRRLVLLDLDGTLIGSRGVGRTALERAFLSTQGWESATASVSFGGMTDPGIVRAVFAAQGLDAAAAAAAQLELFRAYERELEAVLAEGAEVWALPGAPEFVAALEQVERYVVGVLTGNIEGGARRKLRATSLGDSFFRVGAFGDEAPTRNDLLPVALERANAAAAARGEPALRAEDAVVVGDTPRDIAVARAHGARAIAVSTGATPREALAAHEPDVLLVGLEPLAQALAAILD